ncbi:MAG: methylenetetrahydrofolate reductase [Pseudomonadota bacterium]
MTNKIAASIEVSPKQALESADLEGLFPASTRVYITDIGTDTVETIVAGAKRVQDFGYTAVPHFASRRLTTKAALEERVKRLAGEAGISDVLVIGGGLEKQAGDFGSTMEVLETGFFDQAGIKHIGIAGHPEGSPDFDDAAAEEALQLKQQFAERTDSELRIVTQFGFDVDAFISWADALNERGIELPVHLGVAGPAKITTLVKYAAMCGVGNSIQFLKKRAAALTNLLAGFDPNEFVDPVEAHVAANPNSAIKQVHVFPFGGIKKSSEWLKERGSWPA